MHQTKQLEGREISVRPQLSVSIEEFIAFFGMGKQQLKESIVGILVMLIEMQGGLKEKYQGCMVLDASRR